MSACQCVMTGWNGDLTCQKCSLLVVLTVTTICILSWTNSQILSCLFKIFPVWNQCVHKWKTIKVACHQWFLQNRFSNNNFIHVISYTALWSWCFKPLIKNKHLTTKTWDLNIHLAPDTFFLNFNVKVVLHWYWQKIILIPTAKQSKH